MVLQLSSCFDISNSGQFFPTNYAYNPNEPSNYKYMFAQHSVYLSNTMLKFPYILYNPLLVLPSYNIHGIYYLHPFANIHIHAKTSVILGNRGSTARFVS